MARNEKIEDRLERLKQWSRGLGSGISRLDPVEFVAFDGFALRIRFEADVKLTETHQVFNLLADRDYTIVRRVAHGEQDNFGKEVPEGQFELIVEPTSKLSLDKQFEDVADELDETVVEVTSWVTFGDTVFDSEDEAEAEARKCVRSGDMSLDAEVVSRIS